jgi:hypothetical protein
MRQGVTPMNGSGLVTSASGRIPRLDEPELDEGAGQFDTVAPTCACAALAANTRDMITSDNLVAQVLVIPSSLRKNSSLPLWVDDLTG